MLLALLGACITPATAHQTRGSERLPVVADRHSRRLVGIVSRSDLLKPVQARLEEEVLRERLVRWELRGLGCLHVSGDGA